MAELADAAISRRPEVVHWGIDHARLSPPASVGGEVLCVADFYRHKRQDLVLHSWAKLSSPRPPLRLLGDSRVNPDFFATIQRTARRFELLGRITVQDRISFEEMASIYQRARVLILPSEHESFCLPLLEAQACGVPCVTTDLPVLRDTAGEGAIYVNEDRAEAWARAVARLVDDELFHTSLRDAALANAAKFSWDQTAATVAESFVEHG